MKTPKAYTWLNPELKTALKIEAAKQNKSLIDLRPEDLFKDYLRKKKDEPKWEFRL